jgi:arginyl-tRNA synthetase
VTDNHLGDWGAQFGILLYGYKNLRDKTAFQADPVRELARLYLEVRSRFKKKDEEEGEDPADPVKEACRQETAKLHAGDPENLRLWKMFMPACLEEINRIYRRLDVKFDHTLGESFYNPMLSEVVKSLLERGIAQESNGAIIIPRGEDAAPSLIRKTDGAFTYTTTDLATIRYREKEWNPGAILYVVDFRQKEHFGNLFDAARRWGCTAQLKHVSFGAVLSKEGKPLKTREGGVPELNDLLDDAVKRAAQVYEETKREWGREENLTALSRETLQNIYEVVGLGAVKYADLSQNRTSDYKFDVNKMTATDGNTGTYMQYAYARNRNILLKGNVDLEALRKQTSVLSLEKLEERALAAQLLRFDEALTFTAAEYKPNYVTAYLWDLAKSYSTFYDACPVLAAETLALRQSRLVLCDLTARVLHRGLDLLGIRTVERM